MEGAGVENQLDDCVVPGALPPRDRRKRKKKKKKRVPRTAAAVPVSSPPPASTLKRIPIPALSIPNENTTPSRTSPYTPLFGGGQVAHTPIADLERMQPCELVAPPCTMCGVSPVRLSLLVWLDLCSQAQRSVILLCCQRLLFCGRCMRKRLATLYRIPLTSARDLGRGHSNLQLLAPPDKTVIPMTQCPACDETWVDYGYLGGRF